MAEYVGTPGYGQLKDVSAIDLGRASPPRPRSSARDVAPDKIDHVDHRQRAQTSSDALYGARHVGAQGRRARARCRRSPSTASAARASRRSCRGAEQILLGRAKTTLCGGMENMSQAPLRDPRRARGLPPRPGHEGRGPRSSPRCSTRTAASSWRRRPRTSPRTTASRAQEQDEYALRSHQLGAAAVQGRQVRRGDRAGRRSSGRQGRGRGRRRDDHIKPETTLEAPRGAARRPSARTARSRPATRRGIVDGAAAVVVTTRAQAEANGWPCLAEIVDWDVAGVAPRDDGHRPGAGDPRRAASAPGSRVEDVDLFEINEAFAAQYLGCEKELGLDRDKVQRERRRDRARPPAGRHRHAPHPTRSPHELRRPQGNATASPRPASAAARASPSCCGRPPPSRRAARRAGGAQAVSSSSRPQRSRRPPHRPSAPHPARRCAMGGAETKKCMAGSESADALHRRVRRLGGGRAERLGV